MAEKIEVAIIIEIMGKPADYVKETLDGIVSKLAKEKGVKILNKKINEPRAVENDVFTTFADIDLELESIQNLIMILFVYMPSHVEIIKPDEIRMRNYDLNTLANELTKKLHEYDAVAKIAQLRNHELLNQLQDIYNRQAANQPESKEKKVKREKKKSKKSRAR